MSLNSKPHRLALLASGNGSNAEKLMEKFDSHPHIEVALVICNVAGAGVIQRAKKFNIPVEQITNMQAASAEYMLDILQRYQVTHVVLAGYLRLIPLGLVNAYKGRMVNIHPSLLPKYGGQGMYGMRVHEAVVAAHERVSGITIHEVNAAFDEGKILFQQSVTLLPEDTPERVAEKIHMLEHAHFPEVVARWVLGN